MSVEELIEQLGYGESPNFLRELDFAGVPGYSHLFHRATGKCQLRGVYTLKDASAEGDASVVPLVYVCEENRESPGQEIHRLVWNQNIVPFILVAGRDVVRLYSGFSYGSPSRVEDRDADRE